MAAQGKHTAKMKVGLMCTHPAATAFQQVLHLDCPRSCLQMPSFTVDKEALKKGIWGNTWKAWGEMMCK